MDVSGRGFSRVRGFACEDGEAQVLRLMSGLAPFLGAPAGLARALREARKAARSGAAGYDPARHAALVRLARQGGSARGGEGAPRCGSCGRVV
ncbi:hypothetical protein V5F59_15345 [Xanthobacter autotrophicus DSM 431]|uniref:hypothetical protein n=1 Tax=Xanthobacter nonsaccharivorans TaxID=3119912 RepID=UPI003727056A